DESQERMHDSDMFGVDDLEGNEVFVDVKEKIIKKEVSTVDLVTTASEVVTAASVKDSAALTTATTTDVDDELTLEKTLIAIKSAKQEVILIAFTTPRAKGIVFHKQLQAHKPTVSSSKDNGKAKMIEPGIPLNKKDQIALDEEVARKLEAEMRAKIEEDERIAREKDEANRVKKQRLLKQKEIAKLKKKVKKLEKRRKPRLVRLRRLKKVGLRTQVKSSKEKDSLGAQEDASKQGRIIEDIDLDAKIALVDESQERMHDSDMFGVDDLEVTAASVKDSAALTTATTADVDDELTLEKTLIAIKSAKPEVILIAFTTPRAKGIVFHKQVQAHKPTVSSSKDNGKAKM
nr:hypothetical protein [Tanacetum cinerariifolium]